MGKFITIVLILYVVYYVLMILFDLFIKKAPLSKEQNDGENFQIEDFPTEDVSLTDEEIAIEEELAQKREQMNKPDEENDESGDGEISEGELRDLHQELNREEGVQYGEVESQGINIDQLKELAEKVAKNTMNELDSYSNEKQDLSGIINK